MTAPTAPRLGTRTQPPAAGSYRARTRRRARDRDLLDIATIVSVAIAVGLFLSEGGSTRFGTLSEAVTALGVISGLIAMDLVCVMLLLAARVPVIDRTIGHDRALVRHAALGKPVLYLLLAHGALLIAGYALSDEINVVHEVVVLWSSSSDLQLAYLSVALFIIVSVSSVVAARRRLPYEVWHAIHLLTYGAVAVSLPHQFTAGLLSEQNYQRWYWLGLLTFTGAAVLVYRFLVPLLQSLRHQVQVTDVRMESTGIVSIEMMGRDLARLNAQAGQFFNWQFLTKDSWWQSHPYSLSAPIKGNTMRITVRDLGRGSGQLAHLRPGTRVAFEGPYGVFTEAARTGPRLVLIASGIGVAPIRALLEDTSFAPGGAIVILRASRVEDLVLLPEIEDVCVTRGARLYCLVGNRHRQIASWLPEEETRRGYSLASYVSSAEDTDLYICGPITWTARVAADAATMGFTPDSIHQERFAL